MPTQPAATVSFWLKHTDLDWTKNKDGYHFGIIRQSGLNVSAVKRSDGILWLNISDHSRHLFAFERPMPPCDERGLHVEITWQAPVLRLCLNGRLVATQRVPHPLPKPESV
jgi:hypothetical protein